MKYLIFVILLCIPGTSWALDGVCGKDVAELTTTHDVVPSPEQKKEAIQEVEKSSLDVSQQSSNEGVSLVKETLGALFAVATNFETAFSEQQYRLVENGAAELKAGLRLIEQSVEGLATNLKVMGESYNDAQKLQLDGKVDTLRKSLVLLNGAVDGMMTVSKQLAGGYNEALAQTLKNNVQEQMTAVNFLKGAVDGLGIVERDLAQGWNQATMMPAQNGVLSLGQGMKMLNDGVDGLSQIGSILADGYSKGLMMPAQNGALALGQGIKMLNDGVDGVRQVGSKLADGYYSATMMSGQIYVDGLVRSQRVLGDVFVDLVRMNPFASQFDAVKNLSDFIYPYTFGLLEKIYDPKLPRGQRSFLLQVMRGEKSFRAKKVVTPQGIVFTGMNVKEFKDLSELRVDNEYESHQPHKKQNYVGQRVLVGDLSLPGLVYKIRLSGKVVVLLEGQMIKAVSKKQFLVPEVQESGKLHRAGGARIILTQQPVLIEALYKNGLALVTEAHGSWTQIVDQSALSPLF